jgi:SAM-dependent methyltransferase
MNNKISSLTRKVYQKLHARMIKKGASNKDIQKDIYDSLDKSFGIDPKYFKDKIVLDAGCGSEGTVFFELLTKLKCKHVYAFDVGSSFKKNLIQLAKKKKIPSSRYTLASGALPNVPFKQKFDIVICNGVLIHLKNIKEIKKSFKNLSNLTKKNGYFFSLYGNAGGLIQESIFPAIRSYYRKNKVFKDFIDNLNEKNISSYITEFSKKIKKYYGEKIQEKYLKKMFDEVFIQFLHNYIQAPTWCSNETTPKFVENLYKKNGFKKIIRIKKFVKRKNIRKYFSVFHYNNNSILSKVLYGDGYVTYLGKK